MLVGDAVAFDAVDAAGTDIEQQVDEGVGEQIDFVDVEHATVGAGEQTGAKAHAAILQHAFKIEAADQLFFAAAERQIDEATLAFVGALIGQQLG